MILVGNEIGANNVLMAKRYSKLILIWAVVLAFGGVLGLQLFKNHITSPEFIKHKMQTKAENGQLASMTYLMMTD